MRKTGWTVKSWMVPAAGVLLISGLWMARGARLLPSPATSPPAPASASSSGDRCDLPAAPGGKFEPAAYQERLSRESIPVQSIHNPADPAGNPPEENPITTAAGREPSADVVGGDIVPCRSIADPYPILHSVAVDTRNNMVVISDSNRGALLFYNRTGGDAGNRMMDPVWHVTGPATGMMFIAGVAVDPARREVYTVDNDIGNRMMVFRYGADGNAKPERVLFVPHGAWGISLNRSRDEIAISVEHINTIVVYRREASGAEAPLRVIRGAQTGLADPHGLFWDEMHDEIFVTNHGNSAPMAAGIWGIYSPQLTAMTSRAILAPASRTSNRAQGGHFYPPSIRVFPGTGGGDVTPLRVISGRRTELNWPMGIAVDPLHDEIAVANYGTNSVLIFGRTASGDVAPIRVLRGSKTDIKGPMGVAIDTKNNELWVANAGHHSAVVFSRTANGNVSPERVLRNAPPGAPVVGFGNPGAIAYDSRRDELLVPN